MEQSKLQKICDLAHDLCKDYTDCTDCPLYRMNSGICLLELLDDQNWLAKEQTK